MTGEPFRNVLSAMPLVAILRGIKPDEVVEVTDILVEAGFRIVEVPLNSPDPLSSIELLASRFGDRALVGAGTVIDPGSVAEVADAGGRLIVMPHADESVVQAAKSQDLYALPGISTPTEAFRMLAAGADGLKLFPAEANPPSVLKAIRAVLPSGTCVVPVGGITPDKLTAYWEASADGFGLGSALYTPGMSLEQLSANAAAFCTQARALM